MSRTKDGEDKEVGAADAGASASRYAPDVVKILVVEDNADDLELMRLAFRRGGIANPLLAAKDGAEALDLLYQDALAGRRDINLVVLDLTLPRVDGREVLKRIWDDKRLRHIPVIVLSGSKSDVDLISSYKTGAVAFLRKPIQVLDFLQAILDLNSYKIVVVKGDSFEG
jgi:CheY-like chemotaxis protein